MGIKRVLLAAGVAIALAGCGTSLDTPATNVDSHTTQTTQSQADVQQDTQQAGQQDLAAPTATSAARAHAAKKPKKATKVTKKTATAHKVTAPHVKKKTTTSHSTASCRTDYYRNSSGNCVHRPTKAPAAPSGATAKCDDGTYSFSQHRQGTCSHHGGVAEWL
jgi:hypothetical protein